MLIIAAERHRSQRRDRDDAQARLLERLLALIREACEAETPRRPIHPTQASAKRRLDSKQRRGPSRNCAR